MKAPKPTKLFILFVVASIGCLACFVTPALAQTGINITPTNIAMTIAVGDETREVVTLRNISASDVEVEASIEPPAAGDGAMSIAVSPAKIQLKAGESATVEVHVVVPDDAETGIQEGFVSFNVVDADAHEVAIVGKVRTSVNATIIRPISDVEFSIPMFVGSSGPVAFDIRGRNTSQFSTTIASVVELGSLLGEDIVLRRSSDMLNNNETYDMQVLWDDPPLFGIRKVTIRATSGVGSPVARSTFILIFSWKLLPLLLAALTATFLLRGKLPAIANVFHINWRQ